MTEPLLSVQGVSKRFGGFVALDAVDLALERGERLGLIGPNGSGKTTLVGCISGTLTADAGRIVFGGIDVTRLPGHRRTRLGIARSFQIPKPFASMSVLENVCVPIEYARRRPAPRRDLEEEAREVLETMGLGSLAGARAAGLTQMELRKLELARALAVRPALLVCDEAMAGLSGSEVDEILDILHRVNRTGVTIIMIEHIMRAVMGFSERVVVLDAGRKIAEGAPEAVVGNPDVERAYLGE